MFKVSNDSIGDSIAESPKPFVDQFESEMIDNSALQSLDNDQDSEINISKDTTNPDNISNGHKLDGKFLQLDKIIEVLTSDIESHSEVPRTVKENVYFLVDHNANLNRKANAKYMKFWDNCGTWDTKSTSTKTTYFVRQNGGNLSFCVKKKDLYCKEIKKEFIPLDPQPDDTHIFILKRYYATLKRDNNYKKRISWFETMPGFSQDTKKQNRTLRFVNKSLKMHLKNGIKLNGTSL